MSPRCLREQQKQHVSNAHSLAFWPFYDIWRDAASHSDIHIPGHSMGKQGLGEKQDRDGGE